MIGPGFAKPELQTELQTGRKPGFCRVGGFRMARTFRAQSLAQTKISKDQRSFEMTFVDAAGAKRTISMPVQMAADLVPVLSALAEGVTRSNRPQFTKVPKEWAVGRAQHERLVLIKFDEDPPYGLAIDDAAHLWREVREEAEIVSLMGEPVRQ